MLKRLFILLTIGSLTFHAFSQSTYIPNNKDYYHLINRYEIKDGDLASQIHTSYRTYKRSNIVEFADSLQVDSKSDQFNKEYMINDSWEWSNDHTNKSKKPFLKYFYRSKSDLFNVESESFDLHVNPVLYLSYGNESGNSDAPYINTRGAEIRGMIDRKVGFYSFVGENQARFPNYVRDRINSVRVVPHEGFWKRYDDNGVDFFTIKGYFNFNATKHIDLQFGHDNFFIGNGYRSLILSDYAPSFTFLRINTQVWKLKYTNLYGQLTADPRATNTGSIGIGRYPKKYISLHHLSLNLGRKFNIGLFESIMFGKEENNTYELQYLNPIIFYRALEHQNGSADNVLLGMDFKWLVYKNVSLYGQLILDEFLIDNLRAGNGWWGNKYGIQGGLHYVDALGIKNLDIQGEFNMVRPYTYSHLTYYQNYAHFRQPLAHPMGANFTEFIGIIRYQPIPRLNMVAKGIYNIYGTDSTATNNWGGDILKDYSTREMDEGNTIGQGVENKLMLIDITFSYQLKHNLFIDLQHLIRNNKSEQAALTSNTSFTSMSLRLNIGKRLHDF